MSLRLRDILNTLTRKGNAGANIEDFRNEFGDEEMDDIKRLLQAALDLQEIKKEGKSRGVRYYSIDVEVPQIKSSKLGTRKASEENFIEGIIDVSNCVTVKEKVEKIEASEHKLNDIHLFSYRKKIEKPLLGRDLYDHINHGIIDVDVTVGYDPKKKKNGILTHKERILNNKLIISREQDGQYVISKIHLECPDRPEILKFSLQSDFEKCLKTLQPK